MVLGASPEGMKFSREMSVFSKATCAEAAIRSVGDVQSGYAPASTAASEAMALDE